MRYLYTTQPDEGCHEVEKGIFGRPVHTSDEQRLIKKGWTLRPEDLRGLHVRKEKEGREEEGEVNPELVRAYVEKFGKKPHHKMKQDTILQKLDESDD